MRVSNLYDLTIDAIKRHWLIIVAVIAVVHGAFALTARLILCASYDPNIAGVEQTVIYGIQHLLLDGRLYTNPAAAPYAVIMYGPVYFLVCCLVAQVAGLNPTLQVHGLYIIARVISLVSNLVTIGICYRVLTRVVPVGRPLRIISCAACFLLLLPHNAAARPDSLKTLMVMAGIYWFLRYLQTASRWRLVAGTVAVTAAVFVKQDALMLPAIFLSFLLIVKDWRGLIASLAAVIIVGSVGLWAGFIWAGQPFFLNCVNGLDNGVNFHWFYSEFHGYFFKMAPLFMLAFYVALQLLRRRLCTIDLFFGYCSIALFESALGLSLKIGAMPVYFTDFITLAVLMIGSWIEKERAANASGGRMLAPVIFSMAVVTMPQTSFTIDMIHANNRAARHEYLQSLEAAHFVRNRLIGFPGDFAYTNVPTVENALFDRAIIPQLDVVEWCTMPRGVFDYSRFPDMIAQGRVRFLILPQGTTLPKLLGVPLDRFQPLADIGNCSVYQWQ